MLRRSFRALEHIVRVLACLLIVQALAACSRKDDAPAGTAPSAAITGSITYREQTALTDKAVVELELHDVSTDGPAAVVSSQRIHSPGQVPVHFKLEYAAERIDPAHRYSVQARIFEGETLIFATDTPYPVITEGNPNIVEILTIPIGGAVAASPGTAPAAAEPALEGTLTTGDTTATYSAHFEAGKLTSIQEDRDQGARGKAGADYQFKEGRLLRYVERSVGAAGARPSNVELNFAFDDTGELLAATKTINDAGAKPEESEIDAARNRAELLRNHALALKASRDHAY